MIFREDDEGGRDGVTTGEERVLRLCSLTLTGSSASAEGLRDALC